jgi:hypothetical protein
MLGERRIEVQEWIVRCSVALGKVIGDAVAEWLRLLPFIVFGIKARVEHQDDTLCFG